MHGLTEKKEEKEPATDKNEDWGRSQRKRRRTQNRTRNPEG